MTETFGDCQNCGKSMTLQEYYHCSRCGVKKCDRCVLVTIDPSDGKVVCSEQVDSDNLCGGIFGYIDTEVLLK